METVADVVGILVILWGILSIIGAVFQKTILNKGKKTFDSSVFDDFSDGANVVPIMSFVVGVVLIVGGTLITRLG